MYRYLLLPALLLAQDDLERVFHLTNAKTAQEVNEIATVVRVITGIKELQADSERKTIAFRGTQEQGRLADWLMMQLDGVSAAPAIFKAPLAETEDQAVQVFFLNTKSVQDLQEIATLVRSLTDIKLLMSTHTQKAIAVRSTPSQVTLASWLVDLLDHPEKRDNAEYQQPGKADDSVRVFYLPKTTTVQQLYEMATKVRKATGGGRLFTYSASRVIALRGTAEQTGLARQIIGQ